MSENSISVPESGSEQLTVVSDVAGDVQLVAGNADEMKQATSAMGAWFRQKEIIAEKDADELEESAAIAERNNWKLDAVRRQATIARRRVEFFTKCRIAAEAGYCIVPNMPSSLFAIRTKKGTPEKKSGPHQWESRTQRSEAPPAGQGIYVDAEPEERYYEWEDVDPKTGEKRKKREYFASAFEEVEFPISIARPTIMTATAKAMALKCFDELTICVGGQENVNSGSVTRHRGRRGDPLVLGIVRHPQRSTHFDKRITFLIGWYLDTADL